jgi:hypothetical protein
MVEAPVAWKYRIGTAQVRRDLKPRLFAKVVCWRKAACSKYVLLRRSNATPLPKSHSLELRVRFHDLIFSRND